MKRRFIAQAVMALGIAMPIAAWAQNSRDLQLQNLEHQLPDVQLQLSQLQAGHPQDGIFNTLSDQKRGTSAQYDDVNDKLNQFPKAGIDNGRFSIASADGAFSLSLRSLVQFDEGYFAQGRNPASVDLNSGSNFRRAQLGLVGMAWRDWSYNFTYDFGGNGVEKNGYIYYAYIEYTGLAPFHVRVGALTPFLGVEDSTGSGDLLFLERASAQDVARNIAGAPGREGMDFFAQGDSYLLSVSYTGKKTTDAASFDAQQAFVGRASWLAVNESDLKWLLDAGVTYVLKLPDSAANTSASNIFSLGNGTELALDSTKLVNTGNLDASKVNQYEVETALQYDGLYAQGGWDHYQIVRRSSLPDPDFSGWYVEAAYALTGERHAYDSTTASFRNLRPAHALDEGGWGAWEIAARYSNIDLDFRPFQSTANGGVAGGDQNVWTLGLNWYPTNGLKFQLDYYDIRVAHVNAPASGVKADAVGIRSQISF